MSKIILVGRHEVEITQEEKELFPKQHITKEDIITYYQTVAPLMMPYVKDRPIAMQRFPQGVDHEGFFQKNEPDYFPSWIKTKKIIGKNGQMTVYVVINNPETLVYLANQYCITLHIWLSTIEKLHNPDRMVFDLDPSGGAKFQLVRWVAKKLHMVLKEKGLESFLMTTGSRGVHVVVPLEPMYTFAYVRSFAQAVAQELAVEYPSYITLEAHKVDRGEKIYIDILRNAFGQLTVAPYAVRPLAGAPIATPIDWHELEHVTAQKFTIKNIFRRLAQVGDVWHAMKKQKLD